MTQQLKKTALYCRLSKDDERQGESLSIETQKSMLVRYAQENGLIPYEIYVDDGYSGLNFDRPDFQRMIDDVATGKIGVVVVKDLSRFGRDHIVVGQYQELYFPSKKVRFIALNDGIDTLNSHSTDYAALKNVINEFYSRDTSRKIKAAFRSRAKDGKYHSKTAPFGYLKDPDDHNHLIPVPTDEAVRTVENKLLGVETNITNWQRKQNQNNNFSAAIPYDLNQQRQEANEFLDDLTTRDQRMLHMVLTLVHMADSREELDADTRTLVSTGNKLAYHFSTLRYQQMEGLNTALPYGLRKIDTLRTITTDPAATLMPFHAQ